MKIIQEDTTKKFSEIKDKLDLVATMSVDTAGAIVDSQKMDEVADDNMSELRKLTKEPFLGAKKQPVPEKPVEFKIDLEESLLEDVSYDLSELKEDIANMLEEDYRNSLDALAYRVSNLFSDYDPDWCIESYDTYYVPKVDKLIEQLAKAEVDLLFAYAPKNESCNSSKKRKKKNINENKYDDQGHLIDPHDDAYYDALDVPKGPERKRVQDERRKEFLQLHDIEDHEDEWKNMKGTDDELEESDLHTRVHEELSPTDWDKLKKVTKFDRKPSKRYSLDDIYIDVSDGNTVVLSDTIEGLDFAIEVAEAYDVDYDDPVPYRGLFSIKLYTDGLEYIPV